MTNKPENNNARILLMYAAFGIVLMFAVTILIIWIQQEIAQAIPMSILIGALIGVAFKLFTDAINRDQNNGKGGDK